jgi:carbamoyl-phosphate synthase large subunit
VIVTGAGGPAGVAVLDALCDREYVVAADADPAAVGLRLAPEAVVLPKCTDADFVDAIVEAGQGDAALIVTVAEEALVLAGHQDALAASGVRSWLPSPAAVERCLDKWAFAETLAEAKVPAPATALAGSDGVPGPWVVKPRFGRGSRDVMYVSDHAELRYALKRVPDALVQTQLDGREFTADALVDPAGALVGCVPRWRQETRGGISTKGETFDDAAVTSAVAATLVAVGLTGPANVQGFVSADGHVRVTEVNPRFSGGLPLSLAAGADLVGQYLRGVRGLGLQTDKLMFRPGVRMMRRFVEVFEG